MQCVTRSCKSVLGEPSSQQSPRCEGAGQSLCSELRGHKGICLCCVGLGVSVVPMALGWWLAQAQAVPLLLAVGTGRFRGLPIRGIFGKVSTGTGLGWASCTALIKKHLEFDS